MQALAVWDGRGLPACGISYKAWLRLEPTRGRALRRGVKCAVQRKRVCDALRVGVRASVVAAFQLPLLSLLPRRLNAVAALRRVLLLPLLPLPRCRNAAMLLPLNASVCGSCSVQSAAISLLLPRSRNAQCFQCFSSLLCSVKLLSVL